MKKAFVTGVISLVYFYLLGMGNGVALGSELSDIKGHWGEQYIKLMVENGGISGYPDGTFQPDKNITGTEFVSVIVNGTGNTIKGTGDWNDEVMNKAYEIFLVTETQMPKEYANRPLTREEMAMIIIGTVRSVFKEETNLVNNIDNQRIKDIGEASENLAYDIANAFELGVVSGKGDGGYDPKGFVTRAETAVVACKLFGYIERN